jgi:hypothetical protein
MLFDVDMTVCFRFEGPQNAATTVLGGGWQVMATGESGDRGYYKLHAAGFLSSGDSWRANLFCHRSPTGDGSIRWELRHLLPAVGYIETSSQTALRCRVATNRVAWQASFAHCGLVPFTDHFGDSYHALRCKRRETELANASQEYWVSTPGVIGLLLHWRANRIRSERELVLAVANGFINRILEPARVEDLPTTEPDVAVQALCTAAPVNGLKCVHLTRALQSVNRLAESSTPQTSVFGILECLFAYADCAAVSKWIANILTGISTNVDARSWGVYDVLKDEDGLLLGPSGKKRRRLPPAFKEAVAGRAIAENRGHSAEAVLRAIDPTRAGHGRGIHMEHQLVREMQSASWIGFEQLHHVHFTSDGVRVGQPALELFANYCYNPRERFGTPCPPMAPSFFFWGV